jgi:hypothetical protein
MVELLGGQSFEGVTFTTDQVRRLQAYYGIDPAKTEEFVEHAIAAREAERARVKEEREKKEADPLRSRFDKLPEIPKPLSEKEKEDLRTFERAGSGRNIFRHVRSDGLRLMAFLSKFLEKDEDPVKFVHDLCMEAGYDTPNDWEEEER